MNFGNVALIPPPPSLRDHEPLISVHADKNVHGVMASRGTICNGLTKSYAWLVGLGQRALGNCDRIVGAPDGLPICHRGNLSRFRNFNCGPTDDQEPPIDPSRVSERVTE